MAPGHNTVSFINLKSIKMKVKMAIIMLLAQNMLAIQKNSIKNATKNKQTIQSINN